MCLNPIQGNLISEMSKNLIRRQSYLCAPLTWTPRVIYSDMPRYVSQGSGEELLATQLNKWIFWPREVADRSKTRCGPTKIRLHMRKILIKYSPSPAEPHYCLLDGTDQITCATLSSEVTGHLGTTQVWNTDGGQTFCMWLIPHLEVAGRKIKYLLLLDRNSQGRWWLWISWRNGNLQNPTLSEEPYGWESRIFRAEGGETEM